MTIYITPDNKLHDDSNGEAQLLASWPNHAVVATDLQIDAIINAPKQKVFYPLSAWQVRKVLTQFNLRTQVENAISTADQATKDAWAYANEFTRDSVLLNSMGKAFGMTDAQLDQMFTVGITL